MKSPALFLKYCVVTAIIASQLSACDRKNKETDESRQVDAVGKDTISVPKRMVPIIAAGISFTCTPTRVWDGDGPIWCAEGPRIRLAGIAAREMDETCSLGQPCPSVSGKAARDYLANLVGEITGTSQEGHVTVSGPALSCVSEGGARGSRTAAWCFSPTKGDLSCAMIADGSALRWDKYWHSHVC